MYRDHRIAVVVPAYNEELLILDTLETIPDFVDRVFVVDDCSKDATLERARAFAEKDTSRRVTVIHHEKNQGVGAAIVTGYKAALEDDRDKERIDIAAVMAGDNQMDPTFLHHLLDPIVEENADYSMGNRLVDREFRSEMSKWRFFGNALLTLLTKIASGYWQMVDPQNGYTAISRRALETISLNDVYPGYGYCNNILVSLNVYGFRVKNVPHPARYGREASGIRYRTYIFRLSRLLLKDFLWRLKMKYIVLGFHPLIFYYFFGAFISIMSVLAAFWTLYYKFIEGGAMFVPAVTTLLLFSIGAQFLLFAMLFDMQAERNNGGWY